MHLGIPELLCSDGPKYSDWSSISYLHCRVPDQLHHTGHRAYHEVFAKVTIHEPPVPGLGRGHRGSREG